MGRHRGDVRGARGAAARSRAAAAAAPRRRVLELGAGTGLAGLFCSRAFGAAVTLTDQAPLLPLLRANAARSGRAHRSSPVAVRELAWGADRQDDDEAGPEAGPELVLLADVVYDERSVAPLLAEIRRVLARDLAAAPRCECLLLAYKRRDVAAERAFFTQLGGVGVATLRVMTKGHREDAAAELRGSPGPWTPSTEARLAAGLGGSALPLGRLAPCACNRARPFRGKLVARSAAAKARTPAAETTATAAQLTRACRALGETALRRHRRT